jgi:hypothetical protein
MLICRPRHTTGSPGEEGVGSAVAVGRGETVAVAGAAGLSPAEEQAVSRNSPTNRILEVFFIENKPFTFNTLNDLARFGLEQ